METEKQESRKLATIRRVADIRPIEGADAIECVVVDGWQVVAKKGEFTVGDLCVYFEIDSVLPIREEFEFLRKGCYVKKSWLTSESNLQGEGFRLKTIKLRGQISQGLALPLSTFMVELADSLEFDKRSKFVEGINVTNEMGVVKWDPPIPAQLAGRVRGNFPTFIPKTDQERIQNIKPQILQKYANDDFEVTMKLDGSSMTVYHYNERVGVCSRNLDLDWENSPDTTFAQVFIETGLKSVLLSMKRNIAIQGELMGPGIQGNPENLTKPMFFVFDMYDIDESRYLTMHEREKLFYMLTRHGGIPIAHCPLVGEPIKAAQLSTSQLLEMAEGPSLHAKNREGLVFKSIQHPEFSFKAISNKWLLKNES